MKNAPLDQVQQQASMCVTIYNEDVSYQFLMCLYFSDTKKDNYIRGWEFQMDTMSVKMLHLDQEQ